MFVCNSLTFGLQLHKIDNMTIKYNLFALKRQLEIQNSRPYSWKEISAATGIHRNTLQNLAGNKTARSDLGILAALLDFFAAEGMPVTVDQLFTVTS
jgi:hypothetical protein